MPSKLWRFDCLLTWYQHMTCLQGMTKMGMLPMSLSLAGALRKSHANLEKLHSGRQQMVMHIHMT